MSGQALPLAVGRVWDQIPRLPTGKLYKKALRDAYWGQSRSRIV